MLIHRFCKSFAVILPALLAIPSLLGTTYTYTKIADNAPGSRLALSAFPGPFLINNQGAVAFSAQGVALNGIYTGSGSGISVITEDDSGRFILSGFNDSGTVAYLRGLTVNTATAGGTPFVVGQSLTGTVFPVINNAGTVVFGGGLGTLMSRTGSGAVQTLLSDTDLPRTIAFSPPLLFGSSINNSGNVAFYANGVASGAGCNCGTYIKGQAPLTLVAPYTDTGSFSPQINDSGAVAFSGTFQGAKGVFVASGGKVAAVVDLGTQVVTLDGRTVSLNNSGKVAFQANFGPSPVVSGIFTGPDRVADRVIATGDALFGGVVAGIQGSLSPGRFINDKGQIAFAYRLNNAVAGIAVATPVVSTNPPPTLAANGIVNGASFSGEAPAAPGSIVSLFGSNFISQLAVAPGDPLPTTLQDVRVMFNGIAAPLFFVAPGQINAMVPFGVTGTSASVQVINSAGQSEIRTIPIAPQSPAIFTANQTGVGQAVIVFGNTATIVGPVRPGTDWRPAKAGDTITIYANGLGAVTPPINDGWNSCDQSVCTPGLTNLTLRTTTVRPKVKIGNVTVPDNLILFSGLAPEFAGLYQINLTIPGGITASDSVPVIVQMGSVSSPPNVNIALQ